MNEEGIYKLVVFSIVIYNAVSSFLLAWKHRDKKVNGYFIAGLGWASASMATYIIFYVNMCSG